MVLLAVGLSIGLVLGRRRRITLVAPPATTPQVTGPPAKGGYRAGGSISFSETAAPPAHPVAERTEVDGQPGVGDDAAVPRDSVRRDVVDVELPAFEEPVVDDPIVLDEPPAVDEIAPTAGRLGRLRGRLSRSQNAFGRSLLGLLGAGTLDEDSWTDVEDTLLMADLGAEEAAEITATLRREVAAHGVTDSTSTRALLRRVLIEAVEANAGGKVPDRTIHALPHDGRPSVLLIVGVNGTGKTTTTGKLARVLVADGRSVASMVPPQPRAKRTVNRAISSTSTGRRSEAPAPRAGPSPPSRGRR